MRILWHILIVIGKTHVTSWHLYRHVMRQLSYGVLSQTNLFWHKLSDELSIMFDKQLSRPLLHFTALQADKHLPMTISALRQVWKVAAIWAGNRRDDEEDTVEDTMNSRRCQHETVPQSFLGNQRKT